MLSGVDTFIMNIEKNEKIISYLKNIYKIEVGSEAIIPNAYIQSNPNDTKERSNLNLEINENEFATFEEKVNSLNLPLINDKNMKLKIAKLKKSKDTTFLIKHLNLSNYFDSVITLDQFKRVIEGLKILRSVEDINLSKNNLDDSFIDPICELFNIDSLKRIDLSQNNLTKFSSKKLVLAIKNSSRLEYLDLTYNPINSDETFCMNICLAIKSHPNLFHFGLSDSSRDYVLKVLQYKPDLRSLNLDDCRYKTKVFEYLSKYLIDKKYSLAVLSLRYTYLDLFSANFLEKALRVNKSLVYLNLYSSGLSDLAASRVIAGLEYNKTLVELDLGGNRLADTFCKTFNRILKVNNTISKVNLSNNYFISSEGFANLLEGLVNNQAIVSLGDLSDLKIGVKIRESAEIILDLNCKFLDGMGGNMNGTGILNSSIDLNRSQKMNFFKSSIDFEGQERIKRESLDISNEERLIDKNTDMRSKAEEEVILKYDIRLHSNLDDEDNNLNFFIYKT